MKSQIVRTDAILLLTAAIWGFAFVAQRVGMEFIGPFTFNGVRFLLGAASLIPLIIIQDRLRPKNDSSFVDGTFSSLSGEIHPRLSDDRYKWSKSLFRYGFLAGLFLFAGASLQQIGIVYTTAGKSGFITGLYVVLVPLLGIFFNHSTSRGRWIAVVFAVAGLYLLSVKKGFVIERGDFFVFLSAFFWAGHVLALATFSPKADPLKLAILQFIMCGVLSLVVGIILESPRLHSLFEAIVPILYGGLGSVGVAYTLQVIAQKDAHPAHAAIILSLEGVFAVIGGYVILDERLSIRGWIGCVLMFLAMIVSQSSTIFQKGSKKQKAPA